uniref:Uncharacterized protein n=1 Tax=Avena sativa TaxID=4498 RepID=A0ACD5W7D3_AVESA
MSAVDNLIKVFNGWEIQLLVLLSFTLQLVLFFAGRLRHQSSNGFLSLSLWAAYLGADLVAVYALGYLSRHEDANIEMHTLRRSQPLAFFWAPFLLVHLGGQDTITAFAMEDNNLWLRHLLNLVTQVVLALSVFWKSTGKHSENLLLAGSFVFVAGIIKYGERTWSLKCGSLKSIESSAEDRYRNVLPEGLSDNVGFVHVALDSMPFVLDVLAERNMLGTTHKSLDRKIIMDPEQMIRIVKLQLGMIYDDLYTKSVVLRTWSGVILRCISQAAVVLSFVLFHVSDKGRYSKADTAITYSLFVGCFFLEVCSVFVSMMSPWTWAWLKVQKCDALARFSWFVFCRDIGYPKMKQRWPNLIGQYNFYSWLTGSNLKRRTCSQRILILFRKLFVDLFGVQKKKIFFMSSLLETDHIDVDNLIVERVATEITVLVSELTTDKPEEWRHVGFAFRKIQDIFVRDFGMGIAAMHLGTEVHLEKYASYSDMEANGTREDVPFSLLELCGKLSKYMMYLLVHHPSMLPLSLSAAAALDRLQQPGNFEDIRNSGNDFEASKETMEELVRMWTRLLLYAAGRSRPALHVAQLSGGGELITFAWLLMAHSGIGESHNKRIQLTNSDALAANMRKVYAFCLPSEEQKPASDNRSESDVEEIMADDTDDE